MFGKKLVVEKNQNSLGICKSMIINNFQIILSPGSDLTEFL
jgi:hypothetical protein